MEERAHSPVLLKETLQLLCLKDGGVYCDGTVGGGGHASAILRQSSPSGVLYGCDRDGDELKRSAEQMQESFKGRCHFQHGNYSQIETLFPGVLFDAVLLDLGCSSMQLDQSQRGFSFLADGPLDMRMDVSQPLKAEAIINDYSAEQLADIFYYYAGERQARRLARAIVEERTLRRFVSTRQLADFIEARMPRGRQKIHPATRVFQALRIETNQEFLHLQLALEKLIPLIKPGGRLAVITFHSGEDRIVKEFGKASTRDYIFEGTVDIPELRKQRPPLLKVITRRPVEAAEDEVKANPRARSARLRVYEKI